MGFTKSEADPNWHSILFGEDPLILVLYVHDCFIIGACEFIVGCKEDLSSEFEMKEISLMHYLLWLEVW
jgi:hypothetical protein